MSHPVKPDMLRRAIIQRIKSLGTTRRERAEKLQCSPRYLDLLERGFLPRSILHFLEAGVLTLAPDTELAHETDDTKGAEQ